MYRTVLSVTLWGILESAHPSLPVPLHTARSASPVVPSGQPLTLYAQTDIPCPVGQYVLVSARSDVDAVEATGRD